ncbi:MAG: enoyl-CoA hydratase/isomerase family protein [Actinomycetota bacterium]
MGTPNLNRTDDVFVIDIGDDENMTSVAWVAAMNELLDEVDAVDGPKALVTTSSAPKHYSNGLDTPYMASAESGEVIAYVESCFRLVHRLMLLGAPTAAAVTGHAFGLGAFVVLAHDQAVMREDRGFWNLPEVHLSMNFPPGLMHVIRSRIAAPERSRAAVVGHRYPASEAVAAGIVDAALPLDALTDAAIARVAPLAGTAGDNLHTIKRQLYPLVAELVDAQD